MFTKEEIDAASALAMADMRAKAATITVFGNAVSERMLPFGEQTETIFRLAFVAGALWGVTRLSQELKEAKK